MMHTIVVLVEDRPGVFEPGGVVIPARAFNIESLTVGHTENPGVSRMTICVETDDTSIERLVAYLYKLVNVLSVANLSTVPVVSRDLAMIKVSAQLKIEPRSCRLWMCSGQESST